MVDVDQSFRIYRELYDQLPKQGVETEGIPDFDTYQRASGDSGTRSVQYGAVELPIVVPLACLGYMNGHFFESQQDDIRAEQLYYYSHLPAVLECGDAVAWCDFQLAMKTVADAHGVLVYDATAERIGQVDSELEALITCVGGIACQQLINADGPVHYDYASTANLVTGRERSLQPLDLQQLFLCAQAEGWLSGDSRVQAVGSLSSDDVDKLIGYYGQAHAALAESDPVAAGFRDEELRSVLTDPSYTKLVYRASDGDIVNLSIVGDLAACPWFNDAYFKQQYPEAHAANRVICGPGTITNPNVPRSYAPSVLTLGMVGKLVARAGGEVVFTFVCDEFSNAYSPKLAQRAMQHSGLAVDFSLVSKHAFRALRLRPAG